MIARILQKKTGNIYSVAKIMDALNRISASLEEENLYLFDYRSKFSDDIANSLGIDFTKKRRRLASIKKVLGDVKKT